MVEHIAKKFSQFWLGLNQMVESTFPKAVPVIREKSKQYALLMRLNRPIGIYLLGWPAMWALWLSSSGQPDTGIVLIFVMGVILMRSAGCVINDYADREIDPHVARTRERPIASGKVTPDEALMLFVVLGLLALALVLMLNRLSLYISLVAVLSAAVYPFMKRITYIPQAFLGMAFAWAIPMAWAAQTNAIPEEAWLLFIVVILWAMAYDTMYAMADREDDLKIGVKSTAILFGDADRLMIGLIQLSVLAGLVMLGARMSLHWPYYLALAVAAGLGVYQQLLIRNRKPEMCFRAFLNNHWIGVVVFSGIAMNFIIFTA
jgi:4-hydroxybenzoate polyprenyltransferase